MRQLLASLGYKHWNSVDDTHAHTKTVSNIPSFCVSWRKSPGRCQRNACLGVYFLSDFHLDCCAEADGLPQANPSCLLPQHGRPTNAASLILTFLIATAVPCVDQGLESSKLMTATFLTCATCRTTG